MITHNNMLYASVSRVFLGPLRQCHSEAGAAFLQKKLIGDSSYADDIKDLRDGKLIEARPDTAEMEEANSKFLQICLHKRPAHREDRMGPPNYGNPTELGGIRLRVRALKWHVEDFVREIMEFLCRHKAVSVFDFTVNTRLEK
jgi:hypothetical protein